MPFSELKFGWNYLTGWRCSTRESIYCFLKAMLSVFKMCIILYAILNLLSVILFSNLACSPRDFVQHGDVHWPTIKARWELRTENRNKIFLFDFSVRNSFFLRHFFTLSQTVLIIIFDHLFWWWHFYTIRLKPMNRFTFKEKIIFCSETYIY